LVVKERIEGRKNLGRNSREVAEDCCQIAYNLGCVSNLCPCLEITLALPKIDQVFMRGLIFGCARFADGSSIFSLVCRLLINRLVNLSHCLSNGILPGGMRQIEAQVHGAICGAKRLKNSSIYWSNTMDDQ
jgi:hypothetical protein